MLFNVFDGIQNLAITSSVYPIPTSAYPTMNSYKYHDNSIPRNVYLTIVSLFITSNYNVLIEITTSLWKKLL